MRYIIVTIGLLLAGCNATMPQQNRPTAADDPSNNCFKIAFENERLKVLLPRVGSVGALPNLTVDMMTDKTPPTEEEREALKLWADLRPLCESSGTAFRRQYAPPGYDAIYSAGQSALMLLTVRLYAGEITYGEFNMERQRQGKLRAEALANVSRIQAEREAEEDQRRRQAVGQILQNMAAQQQQQQLINQMNRPINTNCNRFGNTVNCTTY